MYILSFSPLLFFLLFLSAYYLCLKKEYQFILEQSSLEIEVYSRFHVKIWICCKYINKQSAQWAMIAHHGASIMFGDTIIYDAQRQVTLNLKQ